MQHTALIYTRVSTQNQNNLPGNVSLTVQQNKCKKYVNKTLGSQTKCVYMTEICSAYKGRNFKNLEQHIETHNPTCIVVYHVSRLSRNSMLCLQFLKKYKNIFVLSVSEAIDTRTVQGRHNFRLSLANAQLESERLGERVRNALSLKRSYGSHIGVAEYGYRKVKRRKVVQGKTVQINELKKNNKEQNIIKFILMCKRGDYSVKQLNAQLRKITNEAAKNPIVVTDDHTGELCKYFRKLNYQNITDLCTDYNILKRNKTWSKGMIARLCNKNKPFLLGMDDSSEEELEEDFEEESEEEFEVLECGKSEKVSELVGLFDNLDLNQLDMIKSIIGMVKANK